MDKKTAVYSRKSKFTGKGESIENQIELCKKYITEVYGADRLNRIVVFEDEGFSGGDTERPRFKEMMNEARRGNIECVVCYRLDRISRNIGDFAKLIEEFEAMDVSFVSIKERFDTSSPMGRAMMYIASVFSQLERETIAERIRDNMRELSKSGRWLGGVTPLGYSSVKATYTDSGGRSRSYMILSAIKEETETVQYIYKRFLKTENIEAVVRALNADGIKTRSGKAFTRFGVKAILTNPVYMRADRAAYNFFIRNGCYPFGERTDFDGKKGIIVYNRSIQKKGRSNKIRPMNEWIIALGDHKGMVSGRDWVSVQAIFSKRERPNGGLDAYL